jgi:hypothetical protein
MKALSLHQPYASAIALGVKRIETRGWITHHRGDIAIHATQAAKPGNIAILRGAPAAHQAAFVTAGYEAGGQISLIKLPLGAVVAIAKLEAIVPVEDMVRGCYFTKAEELIGGPDERFWGDYTAGRFAWVLTDIRRLATRIRALGKQGLWDWTPPADLFLRNLKT